MKKIVLLFIIHCSLIIASCFSQSITWQRVYDGPLHFIDGGMSSCIADSNNFYIAGYTTVLPHDYRIYILKLNPYGDTIWTRIIGENIAQAFAVASSGDGGCVLTGDGGPAFAIKLNTSGQVVWQKTYGGYSVRCLDIKKTNDGGYICCGRIAYYYGFVLKIDSLGNQQWQKTYMSSGFKTFTSITESFNEGYLVVGSETFYPIDSGGALVMKISTYGDIEWTKRFNMIPGQSSGLGYIGKLNNTFLIAGGTLDTAGNVGVIFFVRVDTSCYFLFSKIFPSSETEYFRAIHIININRYVIAMMRDSLGGGTNGKGMIVDSLGKILRDRIFVTPDYIDFSSVMPMSNGDFIFSGIANMGYNTHDDVYAVRTDSTLYAPPISVRKYQSRVPEELFLQQNYPNPFNSSTIINYQTKIKSHIKLKLYDMLGKLVGVVIDDTKNAGYYSHILNADEFHLSSGVYFLKLENEFNKQSILRIVLIK